MIEKSILKLKYECTLAAEYTELMSSVVFNQDNYAR